MKYIAAYLLASLANPKVTKNSITNILNSVGANVDDEQVEQLLAELKNKDINELIASGRSKMATVPTGGSRSAAPAAAAPTTSSAPAPTPVAVVEEKKEPEPEPEEEEDLGLDLFG
eukprot:TRINITY_DN1397_c3_g1_i3.p1 TRINITY_DN1397_c3_g1~~TRINITY_DN1397_c3_g1_i3.p1  ORF type:complete len:116 (-),score=62.14 TRINITY_DN1397_c3_g1_i3:124-471(-)